MRLIVQSITTGRFLAPSADGMPEFVVSLRESGGGVVSDLERACQLVEDYSDFDDICVIVDLDRLGTANDYTATDNGGLF